MTKIQGAIHLALYVSILQAAANNPIPSVRDLPEDTGERRAVRELLDSGFLSDARAFVASGVSWGEVIVLTPAGAAALVEWEDYLYKKSRRGRLEAAGIQVLLVLAGAASTAIGSWIS